MVLKQEKFLFFECSRKGSVIRAFVLFFCLNTFSISSFANSIICKNDKSVRTLRSEKISSGGCRAIYTKMGVDQVVGTSQRETGCDQFIEGIRKTLEASVWKCRDTKPSTVSDLSE